MGDRLSGGSTGPIGRRRPGPGAASRGLVRLDAGRGFAGAAIVAGGMRSMTSVGIARGVVGFVARGRPRRRGEGAWSRQGRASNRRGGWAQKERRMGRFELARRDVRPFRHRVSPLDGLAVSDRLGVERHQCAVGVTDVDHPARRFGGSRADACTERSIASIAHAEWAHVVAEAGWTTSRVVPRASGSSTALGEDVFAVAVVEGDGGRSRSRERSARSWRPGPSCRARAACSAARGSA